MNLINDAWIPARHQSGKIEKIAPWQITDKYKEDPVIEIVSVRPDFNGALIQFLIGLLQTTCAPQGNSDWRKWLNEPPTTDELKKKFKPIENAFNLYGDGPRFMQELTLESEEKKTLEDIGGLLIDSPGGNTLKENKDIFIKRDRIKVMCLPCCAQALLTLQINAPSGGKGHRVGLRGGGPVSTIVTGKSLWQTIWLNTLTGKEFNNLATVSKNRMEDMFPWLAKTRTSENDFETTVKDVHPAQIYWSMPRRIRLIVNSEQGTCALCSDRGITVKEYLTKPYGIKYFGFIHPLTPVYKNKDGLFLSAHQHEAIGYKYWLGYIQETDDGKMPAESIRAAYNRRLNDFRIWVFGYDMDNMKARCWYDGIIPVVIIEDEGKLKNLSSYIAMLINAAGTVSELLSNAVVKSLNAGVFDRVRHRYWQDTESEFYMKIKELREDILHDGSGLKVRNDWHAYLVKKSLEIFDDMSQSDMIDIVNAKRIAKAYNELKTKLYGKKIKNDILGLK